MRASTLLLSYASSYCATATPGREPNWEANYLRNKSVSKKKKRKVTPTPKVESSLGRVGAKYSTTRRHHFSTESSSPRVFGPGIQVKSLWVSGNLVDFYAFYVPYIRGFTFARAHI